MKSDIEISSSALKLNIKGVAGKLNILSRDLELYGKYKAKISLDETPLTPKEENLILVTAINPTPAGEGKSTVTVGLVDSLAKLNRSVVGCLREPSMGPVFGMKGGATGGGHSQVIPMEDINLHFTGDIHAVTSANNLICASLDNSLYQGNPLNINPERILFKRVMDMNDRTLRDITIGQGAKVNGIERKDSFQITVASEVMAVLCLAKDLEDLKEKISNISVAFNTNNELIKVKDLNIAGAVCAVLKEAIKPNLVQTLENNPIIMHGGPFANIAHGCNSLIATKMGLKLADYVVTEAGFGADLGFEKFVDIKSRFGELKPKAVVIVATLRAIKMHGETEKEFDQCDVSALEKGICNLEKHIDIVRQANLNYVVALNYFENDHDEEVQYLLNWAKENNHEIALSETWKKGSEGGQDLAQKVIQVCDKYENTHNEFYNIEDSFEEKLTKLVTNIYGANKFNLSETASEQLAEIKRLKLDKLPLCIAKTPASLSDNPKLVGVPKDFDITVSEIQIKTGANFLVVLTNKVLTLPGLPKVPSAEYIDIDKDGNITGLS